MSNNNGKTPPQSPSIPGPTYPSPPEPEHIIEAYGDGDPVPDDERDRDTTDED